MTKPKSKCCGAEILIQCALFPIEEQYTRREVCSKCRKPLGKSMTTKEMIKFIEDDVSDWDGWEEEDQHKFAAIIKTLQHYEILKKDYKESTCDP